jgi:hypothetical protein
LDDRETVEQISENVYMQYFPDYSSFLGDKPFDASLFVDFRKKLGMDTINTINERIVQIKTGLELKKNSQDKSAPPPDNPQNVGLQPTGGTTEQSTTGQGTKPQEEITHKGKVIFDATACGQDIATHTIEHHIVSIHQPHVRPTVRGKEQAKVELGSKIHVSVIDGISFVDELSWNAFNEGNHLKDYVEHYRRRFGYYPREVLADKIYCTRSNRAWLKEHGITLKGKPLGRPSSVAAVSIHVSPGERNPVEGKFGQAKTGYGLGRIKARLRITSESWIAGIFLVLNLVKLAGAALPCLLIELWQNLTARCRPVGCCWQGAIFADKMSVVGKEWLADEMWV